MQGYRGSQRGALTERQRGSGGGLLLGLVSSDHVATDRAHRHNPWANALAGVEAMPLPLPPIETERPRSGGRGLVARPAQSWRRGHGNVGYTPRDFFEEDDTLSPAAATPEPEESSLWLTGRVRAPSPHPHPHPPTAARPPRVGGEAPADAGGAPEQAALPANGRRQRRREQSSSSACSSELSARMESASDCSSASSWSSRGEARDLQRRANKAVHIIRSVLQSWEGSMRETFQRVDANRSGTIDAAEFATFLRVRLHMNFDSTTIGEIMRRFADGSTGEITYQSFCKLVMGEQSERLESSHQMQKDAAEDSERNAEMILRNRVRRRGNRLREIFDDVDRAGHGALSYDDLRFALHLFGVVMPEAQFDALVRKIDTNNDQVITFKEFVDYFKYNNVDRQLSYVRQANGFSLEAALRLIRETILNRCGASERSVAKCFHVFDQDNSGEVSEEEFMGVLTQQLGLQFDGELAHQIMAKLDTDGNGTIGMEEFYSYVMGMSADAIKRAKRGYNAHAGDTRRSATKLHCLEQ